MAGNVASIPKIVPHIIYPLRVHFILNWPTCAMFCVRGEKKNDYYALV